MAVGANELGEVPVLMYHSLKADAGGDVYARTPDDFRAELGRLAEHGYYPVTAADFETGHLDIPAGRHAVVLTFDDGTDTQFRLLPDGTVDPGTAIGVLEAFAAAHPGFPAVATMFVNATAFPDTGTARALQWLAAHGIEVGDHTVTHAYLDKLSEDGVQREIAGEQQNIDAVLPGYPVKSFALPFGIRPDDHALAVAGSAGGVSYHFAGVYAVGANPSPSPFSAAFNAAYIPRMRSTSVQTKADAPYESDQELAVLYAHPERAYTSDGDPDHVSFPKSQAAKLAAAYRQQANPY